MKRTVGVLALGVLSIVGAARLQATPPAAAPQFSAADVRAVMDKYCITCHNGRLKTAGLDLAAIDFQNAGASAPSLEKVIRKLQAGAMPPAGLPRPDHATYQQVGRWLGAELDRTAAGHPNAGRTEGLHRLNRAEY